MALTFCLTRLRLITASEGFFACRCKSRTNLGQPSGKNSFSSLPKGSQDRPSLREMVEGLSECFTCDRPAGLRRSAPERPEEFPFSQDQPDLHGLSLIHISEPT